jgi:twinkle protein
MSTSTKLGNMIPQDEISYQPLKSRGLKLETCHHYKYGVAEFKGKKVQVAQWFDDTGEPMCQKIRFPDKSFVVLGDKFYMGLFGLGRVQKGGKRIVITEGELDAQAAYQALGGTWPVVSLPNGADDAVKAIKKDLEFLESFTEIVLCFDQDEAGQKAVKATRDLFTTGKVRICVLPRKDAGEMVERGESEELRSILWKAPRYQPEGIITGDAIWDQLVNRKVVPGIPYRWKGLNNLLKGYRQKELILITGGTGAGKSTVCQHLCEEHLANDEKVGYIALEESVFQSSSAIYGIKLGRRTVLDEVAPLDELAPIHAQYGHNLVLLDHFGSTEGDNLVSKLRYFVKALGCTVLFLDHITIAISGLETADERKAIDKLMTDLRSLVEETGVRLYVVSHLTRSKEGSHEDGARIRLKDLRGSHSLGQIPDVVLAGERNQGADDNSERNQILWRVLKNRPVGLLGVACLLAYDHETGLLTELQLDEPDHALAALDPEQHRGARAADA